MVLHILADESHGPPPAVFDVGQKAAFHGCEIANERQIGRGADNLDRVQMVLSPIDRGCAAGLKAVFARERRVAAQELEFLASQLGIAALHFEEFFRVPLDHNDPADTKAVGPHARDVLSDIDVHTLNHGHDRDQGGGRQDDPQQREETAQLARAQASGRADHGFPE